MLMPVERIEAGMVVQLPNGACRAVVAVETYDDGLVVVYETGERTRGDDLYGLPSEPIVSGLRLVPAGHCFEVLATRAARRRAS